MPSVPPPDRKLFCAGLSKTGTTTLGAACSILGLRVAGFSLELTRDVRERGELGRAFDVAREHDVCQDLPWPLIYRELDAEFPGSRFLLLTRESPERWVDSLKRHTMKARPLRHSVKLAFGHYYPHGREREQAELYQRHNDAVRAHFRDRPDDFLELCWERGDGWPELCAFLGRDVPDIPFPHTRTANPRRPFRRSANFLLRSLGI